MMNKRNLIRILQRLHSSSVMFSESCGSIATPGEKENKPRNNLFVFRSSSNLHPRTAVAGRECYFLALSAISIQLSLMERKLLRKEVEKLLGDYVGVTLREKDFDPKGQKQSTLLDDLAHYDLAIGVALQWLNNSDELKHGKLKLSHKYPNRMEREAMILSTFAGTLMHHLPVEDVFEIYGNKHSAAHLQNSSKGHWTQAFNLSLHPFAMLTAPQAAEHAWKHCTRTLKSTSRSFNSTAKDLKTKTAVSKHQETDSEMENTSTGSIAEGSLSDFNEGTSEDS